MIKRPTKGYWWECTSCNACYSFKQITSKGSVASFIWDVLAPSDWEQSLLNQTCSSCGKKSVKITYDFPKSKRTIIHVNHIVGRKLKGITYVPMLWETEPATGSGKIWYDFKYQIKRNNFGLNKPAVMQASDLNYLLDKFSSKTGKVVV